MDAKKPAQTPILGIWARSLRWSRRAPDTNGPLGEIRAGQAKLVPSTCNRNPDHGFYMMVTMPNGEIRTRAFPDQPIEHCWQRQKNLPSALVWCIPDRSRWINVIDFPKG